MRLELEQDVTETGLFQLSCQGGKPVDIRSGHGKRVSVFPGACEQPVDCFRGGRGKNAVRSLQGARRLAQSGGVVTTHYHGTPGDVKGPAGQVDKCLSVMSLVVTLTMSIESFSLPVPANNPGSDAA